ncbi:hypothetical protein KQX54_018436 [Cotesia glomerata]|uniref:Uncharacterized protein n=1 Tax=Cotesia glomerata TaxID=32391 RepID=A0AAV7IRU8_COTGL|nr:hypothetical protein KQX54_018436 [Cotesia glomerata]
MLSMFVSRKRKREEMAATKNPTAVDEEMEIIEEYFILDPDDIDDQREEMDQMEVEESNVLFCYNNSNNLSKTINFDHTITRESASYFGNSYRVYSEKSEERSSRNPRGLDESKFSLLHEKNTILTKRGISNNSLTNQTLIDSNQVFSENSDERSSQGCSGLDKSEIDLLHEHNELLDNCSISGNSSTNHTILHTIQVFSEKSEEKSSRDPIVEIMAKITTYKISWITITLTLTLIRYISRCPARPSRGCSTRCLLDSHGTLSTSRRSLDL